MGKDMLLIGKIEKKVKSNATILVKRKLLCEKCKRCSAGCYLYNVHIQKELDNDYNVGDSIELKATKDLSNRNNLLNYGLPIALTICLMTAVIFIPSIKNKDLALFISLIASLIISGIITNLYDKKKMKEYGQFYEVIKRIDE